MRKELWFNVLLNLPLNIYWRLIGLNKNLGSVFKQELFWRRRCEREWSPHQRHTIITNHRHYFLVRAAVDHGKFFDKDMGYDLGTGFWYYALGENEQLLLEEGVLYHCFGDHLERVIAEGIKQVVPIRSPKLYSCYHFIIVGTDRSRFLAIENDKYLINPIVKDEFEVRNSCDRQIINYDKFIDYSDETEFDFLLLNDGRLLHGRRRGEEQLVDLYDYAVGVLQMLYIRDSIVYLTNEGELYQIILEEAKLLQKRVDLESEFHNIYSNEFDEPYHVVFLDRFDDGLYMVLSDGRTLYHSMERYGFEGDDHSDYGSETISSRIPIRRYLRIVQQRYLVLLDGTVKLRVLDEENEYWQLKKTKMFGVQPAGTAVLQC